METLWLLTLDWFKINDHLKEGRGRYSKLIYMYEAIQPIDSDPFSLLHRSIFTSVWGAEANKQALEQSMKHN